MLVDEYGVLKLSDFGMARKLVDLIASESEGSKKGTPYYMAPELFQDQGIYSF